MLPAGYLQLNSWHSHKYLILEMQRLISSPRQKYLAVRFVSDATCCRCNNNSKHQQAQHSAHRASTKGICRSVKQQFHELLLQLQRLIYGTLVHSSGSNSVQTIVIPTRIKSAALCLRRLNWFVYQNEKKCGNELSKGSALVA